MKQSEVEQGVQGLIEPAAESFGLELVLVQYRRESGGWMLRILVDRPGGVSIDDCAELSREISNLMDVEDLIPGAYRLEVSSPGLDRPLVRPEDFKRYAGKLVTLRTVEPVNGRRNFKGTLGGIQGESVVIRIEQESYEIEFAQIEKANLVPVLEGV